MVESWISEFGLIAIFILMFCNGFASAPPSELVLPLAGIFAQQGHSGLAVVILVSSAGNLAGTTALYFVGRIAGIKPAFLVRKWLIEHKFAPRFVLRSLPSEGQLKTYAVLFARNALFWVCILRCAPYVRSIISLPAGSVKTPLISFLIFSSIGISVWSAVWNSLGYTLAEVWVEFSGIIRVLAIVMVLTIGALFWIGTRRLNAGKIGSDIAES